MVTTAMPISAIRKAAAALAAGVMLAWATPAPAVTPDEMLADPALESRARDLSRELRCLVCQNQDIDDSNAPLARDLRLLVRERLQAGDSDPAVLGYITARYGDFVLLKPPFQPNTWLLWLTPAAVLVAGGIGVAGFLFSSRRRAEAGPAALSEDEQRRLNQLLGKDDHR